MIKIHFLNVGHGDCIIVENFDTNRNTIIDINRSNEMDSTSLTEVSNSYITNNFLHLGLSLESKGYDVKLNRPYSIY